MTTKTCTKCKEVKSIEEFAKNSRCKYGVGGTCKPCRYIYQNNWFNIRYHTDKVFKEKQQIYTRQKRKEAYRKNPVLFNNRHSEYIKKLKIENPEKYCQIRKVNNIAIGRWKKLHPKENKLYAQKSKLKMRSQPKFRISNSMSQRIRYSLKKQKHGLHWESLAGYTLQDLMKHLESQFTKGMTWENYGKWHIDHIKPITVFNIQKINDSGFKECWRLENLQPLWAIENERKNCKYIAA